MLNIRHVGIYVEDIEKESEFYKKCFQMIAVSEKQKDRNILLDELLEHEDSEIITTKLITPTGKQNGQGDMIELVKIVSHVEHLRIPSPIYNTGMMHIAIEVEGIDQVIDLIAQNGGCSKTKIVTHANGNRFAFAIDPEGNWLELIERH